MYDEEEEVKLPTEKMAFQTTPEMRTAIEYIVENAKGLGFMTIDEFIRTAVRLYIMEISETTMQR
jgi:hypothetical protein